MSPFVYDLVLWPAERLVLGRMRRRLLARATGLVLEVGCGTGASLAAYPRGVTVVATDPYTPALARTSARARRCPARAEVAAADAMALPFANGRFDTVVSALALCSVPGLPAALGEMRRVLRPGGTLLLLEHVRSNRRTWARLQDALTPAWRRVGRGCELNRDTAAAATAAGFVARRVGVTCGGWLLTAEFERAGR